MAQGKLVRGQVFVMALVSPIDWSACFTCFFLPKLKEKGENEKKIFLNNA